MSSFVWHNAELRDLRPAGPCTRADLDRIEAALNRHGTLTMRALPSGLFPAAAAASSAASGYNNVWVRDNVYVAYAHHLSGDHRTASGVARGLLSFFSKSRERFEAIIARPADAGKVMLRPHVRFDGETLEELPRAWSHAQNDALGYALWLFGKLTTAGVLTPDAEMVRTLALFPAYFDAIRYWEDEDSGHWEETRKRSASSIGTVLAGLDALLEVAQAPDSALRRQGFPSRLVDTALELAQRGRAALDAILPSECIQPSPRKNRRYDAALLFLLHPLAVVRPPVADVVLSDIEQHLAGECGVRRYLGDSYFAPDYEERLSPEDRSRDYSEDLEWRDALFDVSGTEAQWCIFDPIISAYYGRQYRETGSAADRERQALHFDRALSQIDADWCCPELYYLRRGVRVPGANRPLLWAQANLTIALLEMRANL